MNIVLVSGDGHCPACEAVKRKLDQAGIEYQEDNNAGNMFQLASALGVGGRPILISYTVGNGSRADELIERMKGVNDG